MALHSIIEFEALEKIDCRVVIETGMHAAQWPRRRADRRVNRPQGASEIRADIPYLSE